MLSKLSWRDKCNFVIGYCLVKSSKLTFDQFSEKELEDIALDYLPFEERLDVPIGEGNLTCLDAKLTMPAHTNRLTVELLSNIEIRVLGTTIYQTHVIVGLSSIVNYFSARKALLIQDIQVDFIHLVNDKHSILKNTQFIIDQLIPKPLSGLSSVIGAPLRSALNIVSAGSSEQVLRYLNLYINGSSQKVLDYHRPRITQQLISRIEDLAPNYTMNPEKWRECLFSHLGKRVAIEENTLRFYFTDP